MPNNVYDAFYNMNILFIYRLYLTVTEYWNDAYARYLVARMTVCS